MNFIRSQNLFYSLFHFIVFTLLISGCNKIEKIPLIFSDTSTPYENYISQLEYGKLDSTLLGNQWITNGEDALDDSLMISFPYQESGYFQSYESNALSFLFQGVEGGRLNIEMEVDSLNSYKIFIDLFKKNGNESEHIKSADESELEFTYRMRDEDLYVLRIQPEILAQGHYKLKIYKTASLFFPVLGANRYDIGSVYGVDRDGGRRMHEGIDIFAARGTPALAAVNGQIDRVGVNNLGGNVIWLRDEETDQRLYYAHLDSQIVRSGEYVELGDTLGLVGNTGNAITTAPHLHFGIYRSRRERGSDVRTTDPYPYVYQPGFRFREYDVMNDDLNQWMEITEGQVNLRIGPSSESKIIKEVEPDSPIKLLAISENWAKVELTDNSKGFILYASLQSYKSEESILADKEMLIYSKLGSSIPQDLIVSNSQLNIQAELEGYYLVLYNNKNGWISKNL